MKWRAWIKKLLCQMLDEYFQQKTTLPGSNEALKIARGCVWWILSFFFSCLSHSLHRLFFATFTTRSRIMCQSRFCSSCLYDAQGVILMERFGWLGCLCEKVDWLIVLLIGLYQPDGIGTGGMRIPIQISVVRWKSRYSLLEIRMRATVPMKQLRLRLSVWAGKSTHQTHC